MLRERRCLHHLIRKHATPCFLCLSNPTDTETETHTQRESVCIHTSSLPSLFPPTPQESPSLTYFALPYPSCSFPFQSLLHSTIYLSIPPTPQTAHREPKKKVSYHVMMHIIVYLKTVNLAWHVILVSRSMTWFRR